MMNRKKKRRDKALPTTNPSSLTTDMRLEAIPVPTLPPPSPASSTVRSAQRQISTWVNNTAARSAGPPGIAKPVTIVPGLKLVKGVYIMSAPTGAGKTITSLAMTAMCNANSVPATYICCFEPRQPTPIQGVAELAAAFSDPASFISDIKGAMGAPKSKLCVVVVDSVTLPLKTYASGPAYRQQATFPGGMQPSDRGFVTELGNIADVFNVCLIVNVNSSLVPYVDQLAGATEGLITLSDVGNINYMDRTAASGRKMVSFQIPTDYIDAALNHFGYGPYNRTNASSFSRGFEI